MNIVERSKYEQEWRGTGRTTSLLQLAIDHAVAHWAMNPDKNSPVCYFVVNHRSDWEYLKGLLRELVGYNSVKRTLTYRIKDKPLLGVEIHVVSREQRLEKLRGTRWPIVVDHAVWEDKRGTPEELYLMQDRVVNFN